jgi:outer membrane receptor protein involved in Fe transport
MKNTMRIFAAAMFALCLSLVAMGQSQTTGSIEGTVTDPQGAVVPGAQVEVTSPNLIRAQSATTGNDGRFRIGNLPPGKYTVTVAPISGFGEYKQENVEVNLSHVTTLTASLVVGSGGPNVVDVNTGGAAIDTTGNTSGTNVSTEQFSNFPTQRTVQSLYSIAPTVARSGLRDASGRDRDPSVGGSSGPENNYILDGVNTSDPAFGGSGANLPFEFVQEVEIKTGAYGAEYGKSTGGIFNVITKSGGDTFRGDAFGYFTTRGLVRSTKQFPFTGAAPDGFSEIDAGIDVGGPISKGKLWFFGAFNPQRRKNNFLTQTFHAAVENEITTPFYSGKITWSVNNNNTFTFSTFGDFTKQEGFLFGGNGFGNDLSAFRGEIQTGGHNYTARMNSTITPNMIGEFAFGLHFQRANTLPESATTVPLITDNFAVLRNGAVLTPTHTAVVVNTATGTGDFINGDGGTVQRNFSRGPGFGLFSTQDRNRWEFSARMQNVWGRHTIKYGFEYGRNIYKINTISTGVPITYSGVNTISARITNNFAVCVIAGTEIRCPSSQAISRIQALITAGVNLGGPTSVNPVVDPTVTAQLGSTTHPFLIRTTTRVRDFRLIAPSTHTNVESFYVQDDFKLTRNITLNGGLRWDYQQAFGSDRAYVKLNNFKDNLQPRVGIIWDFTGEGKGKIYFNYARFLETPLPLDLNVRAGSDTTQTDINLNGHHQCAGWLRDRGERQHWQLGFHFDPDRSGPEAADRE